MHYACGEALTNVFALPIQVLVAMKGHDSALLSSVICNGSQGRWSHA